MPRQYLRSPLSTHPVLYLVPVPTHHGATHQVDPVDPVDWPLVRRYLRFSLAAYGHLALKLLGVISP